MLGTRICGNLLIKSLFSNSPFDSRIPIYEISLGSIWILPSRTTRRNRIKRQGKDDNILAARRESIGYRRDVDRREREPSVRHQNSKILFSKPFVWIVVMNREDQKVLLLLQAEWNEVVVVATQQGWKPKLEKGKLEKRTRKHRILPTEFKRLFLEAYLLLNESVFIQRARATGISERIYHDNSTVL